MVDYKRAWGRIAVWMLLFGAIYLVTRLYNLTGLPIFTDEAIYIRWAQIGAQDASWRFISLVDGKQPMFTWVMMALLRLIPQDPLFIGRLTSVIAGMASLVGIWLLSYELFKSKHVSLAMSLIYIISPFTLLYDRMALYDSMVVTFSVWSLYLSILLVRRLRLDIALLLGMVLGLGMLNKSSGFLSLYLAPLLLILFDWKKEERMMRLVRWVGFVGVSATVAFGMYSILRLSPYFHIIAEKNNVFLSLRKNTAYRASTNEAIPMYPINSP